MTTQEEKIIYRKHRDYSRYALGAAARYWHMEVSDVECFSCIIGHSRESFRLSKYVQILNSTRGYDIFFEPDIYGCTYPMVSRGGLSLAYLANREEKENIGLLLEAGAVPDEDYTKFRYGDSNGVWEYLQEVYTEFRRKKMAKPAFSVHN
jgi:hypothetical protein